MTATTRFRSAPFRLLMLLALLAMAIRAAVPAGFMLAPDQDRWVVVTLCSGPGPMPLALNLDTGEQREGALPTGDQEDAGDAHGVCVFAAAGALSPPAATAELSRPALAAASRAPAVFPFVTIGRGLAAPPPWATGPPILAL